MGRDPENKASYAFAEEKNNHTLVFEGSITYSIECCNSRENLEKVT